MKKDLAYLAEWYQGLPQRENLAGWLRAATGLVGAVAPGAPQKYDVSLVKSDSLTAGVSYPKKGEERGHIIMGSIWASKRALEATDLPVKLHPAATMLASNGAQVHEAGHIRYKSWLAHKAAEKLTGKKKDEIGLAVNIIEDNFIEPALDREFPALAPFIRGMNQFLFSESYMRDLVDKINRDGVTEQGLLAMGGAATCDRELSWLAAITDPDVRAKYAAVGRVLQRVHRLKPTSRPQVRAKAVQAWLAAVEEALRPEEPPQQEDGEPKEQNGDDEPEEQEGSGGEPPEEQENEEPSAEEQDSKGEPDAEDGGEPEEEGEPEDETGEDGDGEGAGTGEDEDWGDEESGEPGGSSDSPGDSEGSLEDRFGGEIPVWLDPQAGKEGEKLAGEIRVLGVADSVEIVEGSVLATLRVPAAEPEIVPDPRFEAFGRSFRCMATPNRAPGPAERKGRVYGPRIYRIATDGRICGQPKELPKYKKDFEVALLVDCSGSMTWWKQETREDGSRVRYLPLARAREVGLGLKKSLDSANIPCWLYGHTADVLAVGGDGTTSIYLFAPADRPARWQETARVLAAIHEADSETPETDPYVCCDNRDGMAVRWVAEHGFRFPNRVHVMIVLSDGQPSASPSYSGMAANTHTREQVAKARQKGITVLSLSVTETAKQACDYIYGKANNVFSEDPAAVGLMIEQIMEGKR